MLDEPRTTYRVTACITHHTTDKFGVSIDKTIDLPTFLLDGMPVDTAYAEEEARKIILPVELQYESVSVRVSVEELLYRSY